MRFRTVPCLSPRYDVVPSCAVLYFEHTVPGSMRNTRCQVPVCTCAFVFFISPSHCPLSVLFIVFVVCNSRPYCRSERDIANKHTAQYRAIRSAQVALGNIRSLVAPSNGPLISALFEFSCIFLARTWWAASAARGAEPLDSTH